MTGWWMIPLLTGFYMLVLSSMKPGDWVIGAVLASGLWIAARPFLNPASGESTLSLWHRVCYSPLLAGAVVWEILRDTWRVALFTVGWKPANQPGFIAVPIGERSDQGLMVSGILHSLTPSSYLVNTDLKRRAMIFRVLDGADVEAASQRFEHFYQHYQRHVFP
jgi:multisubunit Na+/H+ antiporter MnhE subunit